MTDRNPDYHCEVCRKYLFSTRANEPMAEGPHYCKKHKPAKNARLGEHNGGDYDTSHKVPDACKHEDFTVTCGVGRLTDGEGGPVTGYVAELRIKCSQCGKPFQFLGLEAGYDNQGARVSLDGLEANLAISPEGMRPNPLQRMSYSIKAHN